jgi:S-methylmethionine-dependent homocysteine/selenocysteine methylase
MTSYSAVMAKLAAGRIVIIDGGTGTEIQSRGVPMSGETWCAEANLTHPDVVRKVHADYVDAGAELVIANTFATSPLLFDHLGRTAEVATIDRAAIGLARQAASGRVPVAASFSTMRPVRKGTDRTSRESEWSSTATAELFRRKAGGLAEAGADLIVMEMMRDADYSLWATEAAVATGLPVWVGLSVERGPDGDLHGFGRPDTRLEDFVSPLMETGAEVLAIMHTSPDDTTRAIPAVRERWSGPLGCYPESGYFTMPDWQFVDIIPVPDLVALAETWVASGVRILGGCCGIGPEHIRGLVEAFGVNRDDE